MQDRPKKPFQAQDEQVLTIQAIKKISIPASGLGLGQSPAK